MISSSNFMLIKFLICWSWATGTFLVIVFTYKWSFALLSNSLSFTGERPVDFILPSAWSRSIIATFSFSISGRLRSEGGPAVSIVCSLNTLWYILLSNPGGPLSLRPYCCLTSTKLSLSDVVRGASFKKERHAYRPRSDLVLTIFSTI